jgi:hypothetical protein
VSIIVLTDLLILYTRHLVATSLLKMRVLIPFVGHKDDYSNPFIFDHIQSMAENGATCVYESIFTADYSSFDIVHFHWPEHIFSNDNGLCNIDEIENIVLNIRKSAKIVLTIHNLIPHNKYSSLDVEDLYLLVLKYSDAFVHFNEYSKAHAIVKYNYLLKNKPGVVIYHGNYNSLINRLKVPSEVGGGSSSQSYSVMTFGAIRNWQELFLIIKSFRALRKIDIELYVYGKVRFPRPKFYSFSSAPYALIKIFEQLVALLYLKYHIPSVNLIARKINNNEISEIMHKHSILFIPRVDELNSGVVTLGFTFGLTIVGVKSGPVGEFIINNNNVCIGKGDYSDEIIKIFNNAFELQMNNQGVKNKNIANLLWSWERSAEKHIEFFKSLD